MICNNNSKAFIRRNIRKIQDGPQKDIDIRIKKALCYVILPNYDEFAECYKMAGFKKFQSLEDLLSHIFKIESTKMQTIINQFKDYKNINEKDIIPQCMAVKI